MGSTYISINSISSILKELYSGETEVILAWKAGELTELEIVLYASEINNYKGNKNVINRLVYTENPFLKLIK
jgi:hypothetical protein